MPASWQCLPKITAEKDECESWLEHQKWKIGIGRSQKLDPDPWARQQIKPWRRHSCRECRCPATVTNGHHCALATVYITELSTPIKPQKWAVQVATGSAQVSRQAQKFPQRATHLMEGKELQRCQRKSTKQHSRYKGRTSVPKDQEASWLASKQPKPPPSQQWHPHTLRQGTV